MKFIEMDGNSTALEQSLVSKSKDLQKFIYTLTSDPEAVEEILQRTIVTAFANLSQLRNPDLMISWVFNIAKTEASHYFRAYNAVGFREGTDTLSDNMEGLEDDVLDKIVEKEFRTELRELVNKLEDRYLKIILLHYYYGLDLKEIALICKINYSTVRTNHRRGIEKLKELYEEGMRR